jgi:Type VI secretion system protein DotU
MTEPIERPQSVPSDIPQRVPEGEPPPVPVDAQMAVQQLRDAGFSADQQAALTTALLRVLALWTQQATRGDLQTELHAGEQRLAQQLDALHAEIRREVAQHTNALREELQSEFARHADLLHATRVQPARKSDVSLWLITALLVLTCAGVFLLVGRSVLGW